MISGKHGHLKGNVVNWDWFLNWSENEPKRSPFSFMVLKYCSAIICHMLRYFQ